MAKGREIMYKETLYKSLFETATDSIFLMDKSEFIECNKKTLEIFGCSSKDDILGKGPLDFSPRYQPNGELSEALVASKLKLAMEDKSQQFEWKHSKLGGGEFYAEISLNKLEVNKELFLIAIVRDITKRKMIENELLNLQEYHQLQIDRMPIGLIGFDTEYKIVSWNPSAEKIFGYTEEEALGSSTYDLIIPDSVVSNVEVIMKRLLSGDESASNTNQNITKDRQIIICRWSNTPLTKSDGSVIGVLSMVEDISEQYRAEEELKTYQDYLEELVRERTTELEVAVENLDEREKSVRLLSEITSASNMSDDPEEAIIFAIERLASHTGWPFGHMVYVDEEKNKKEYSGIWYGDKIIEKERIEEILKACMHESPDCAVNRAIQARNPMIINHKRPYICSLISNLVTEFNLDSSFVFPIEIDNRIIGVIQFLYTTGDQPASKYFDLVKQISAQLAMAIERKRIREELLREKKNAEDANRFKSQFLANMSHEIRTPMNSIMGFTDILSTKLKVEKNLTYLDSIKSSGASLLRLINDILDLSKIEADKVILEYHEVDTEGFFNEIFSLFEPKIREKGLKLVTIIKASVPSTLIIDELRMRQVLLNLISNALKFTQTGSIELTVCDRELAENKFDLYIEVKDTGIGISEDFLSKIFDSFQQEDERLNRRYEGTGLGLSITKKLVELMNGDISVKSEKGKGTTFTVKIESLKGSKIITGVNSEEENADEIFFFDNAEILLVEDNLDDQLYFINLLEDAGQKVRVVLNGEEALWELKTFSPVIILIDLRIPGIGGYKLLEILREDESYTNIPVIAISAAAMPEDISRIEAASFDEYLIKPVAMAVFNKMLRNYIPYSKTEKAPDQLFKGKIRADKLSPEIKLKLPAVIDKLETLYIKDWEKLRKKQAIKKVVEFGKNIRDLGDENSIGILSYYGKSLLSSVESFDIQTLKNNIYSFPDLITYLKKME